MAEQSNLDWQYLMNQFRTSLEYSYSLTNTFIKDHRSKLEVNGADPEIDRILQRTIPIHDDFVNNYALWETAIAFWKGATNTVDRKLEELAAVKIPRWDVQVQIEFPDTSSEYITLFPRGRTGFREGSKDDRLNALKSLVNVLAEYPILQHVYTDAKAYYEAIDVLRFQQQQHEKKVRDAASELRAAQEEVFIILYQNLGGLMQKFARSTDLILNYYQVELIRNTGKKAKDTIAEETNAIKAIEPI